MLACIACSAKEGGEDGPRAAAMLHGKDAVKSLTSQLKDMVLKFSGGCNKQYKGAALASRRVVHGEDYYSRTSTLAATGAARSNREWQQHRGGKRPGVSGSVEGEGIVAAEEVALSREWTAQVEPGVQITFVTLSGGCNDLKRIRFSREIFDKWEAQRWWGENYGRIVELYNVTTFSGRQQGASTPASSVDDSVMRDSSYSRGGSTIRNSPVAMLSPPTAAGKEPVPQITPGGSSSSTRAAYYPSTAVPDPSDHVWAHHFNMLNNAEAGSSSAMGGGVPSSYDPSRTTTPSRDEASVSVSNASDMGTTEWIEEDEPGVCLTIRELGDGTRELRRVRFSRERFCEERAKEWWEQNRDRVQVQYL